MIERSSAYALALWGAESEFGSPRHFRFYGRRVATAGEELSTIPPGRHPVY